MLDPPIDRLACAGCWFLCHIETALLRAAVEAQPSQQQARHIPHMLECTRQDSELCSMCSPATSSPGAWPARPQSRLAPTPRPPSGCLSRRLPPQPGPLHGQLQTPLPGTPTRPCRTPCLAGLGRPRPPAGPTPPPTTTRRCGRTACGSPGAGRKRPASARSPQARPCLHGSVSAAPHAHVPMRAEWRTRAVCEVPKVLDPPAGWVLSGYELACCGGEPSWMLSLKQQERHAQNLMCSMRGTGCACM